jgi:hypothetical protein
MQAKRSPNRSVGGKSVIFRSSGVHGTLSKVGICFNPRQIRSQPARMASFPTGPRYKAIRLLTQNLWHRVFSIVRGRAQPVQARRACCLILLRVIIMTQSQTKSPFSFPPRPLFQSFFRSISAVLADSPAFFWWLCSCMDLSECGGPPSFLMANGNVSPPPLGDGSEADVNPVMRLLPEARG